MQGNIFDAETDSFVNPVNCAGVMGKGLALEFKKRFPTNFSVYKEECSHSRLFPGKVFSFNENGKTIFNFPTKDHWKENSNYKDIERGLNSLVVEILRSEVKSVAIPALGCGLGGLDFGKVSILIQRALIVINNIEVFVYINPT